MKHSNNQMPLSGLTLKGLRSISLLVLGLIVLMSTNYTARAQDVGGQIAFGFDAGGNKYWGNYSDSHFGFQGDAFIKWNIIDWVSLIGEYNGGVLGYKSTAGSIANENGPVFNHTTLGSDGSPLGSLNHIRDGGWDLMGSLNVFPDQTFVPCVFAGIEALNFEPDDASPSPLRGNASAAYSKNVIGGVFGVGFEMFITPKVTFTGQGLVHLTGTDWLDDYSDPNNYRQDAYLSMGLGFSYYIFAPPAPAPVMESGNNVTNVTNNYTTNNTTMKTDTVIVTNTVFVQQTDTVYKTRVQRGTVYNFPGTLFIVNTDQFNTEFPGNDQNMMNIKRLVNQCPALRVVIQGHASDEGPADRNQQLSDMRAQRIKTWLISQGVDPNKIAGTEGLGTSDNAVAEPADATPAQLEAARMLNRRISIKVVEGCN